MEKKDYHLNDLIVEINDLTALISEKTSHLTFQDYCERGNREILKIRDLLIKALLKKELLKKENLEYEVFLEMPEEIALSIEKEFPLDMYLQNRKKQWWWITEGLKNVLFLQN